MRSRPEGEPHQSTEEDSSPFDELPAYDLVDGELVPRGVVIASRPNPGADGGTA